VLCSCVLLLPRPPPPCLSQGDGFITNRQAVEAWNISTPSDMFTTALTDWVGSAVRVERGESQVSSRHREQAVLVSIIASWWRLLSALPPSPVNWVLQLPSKLTTGNGYYCQMDGTPMRSDGLSSGIIQAGALL